jgi:hypothetical protein
MTEIVIVPAWRRPAFLAACLHRLTLADDPSLTYWISLDRGHTRDVAQVAYEFAARMGHDRVRLIGKNHRFAGNSFNILDTYREALTWKTDLIHLVEEDVLVSRDYFQFHRSAHETAPDVFAVSGCRSQNYRSDPPNHDDAVYLDHQYQSIGVSFRPEQLRRILPHLAPLYFRAPIAYCRKTFPHSTIPEGNAEQDGLLNRIAEKHGLQVAYACRPRAYHAGFVGYHRNGAALKGTVHEQASQILAMDSAEMNAAAHSYPDHAVVSLDEPLPRVSRIITWPHS